MPTEAKGDRWQGSKEWKRKKVAEGRCAQCGKRRDPNGTRRLCRPCADKQAAHLRNHRQRIRGKD